MRFAGRRFRVADTFRAALALTSILCLIEARAEDASDSGSVAFVAGRAAVLDAADVLRHKIVRSGKDRDVFAPEVRALQELGERGARLADGDAALRALYREAVIPRVVRVLGAGYEGSREEAASALDKIGTDALSPILAALARDPEPRVRAGAAWALGRRRHRLEETVAPLAAALHDPETFVHYEAAKALTELATVFVSARAPLVRALGDSDVREAVAIRAADGGLAKTAPELQAAFDERRAANPVRKVAATLFPICVALAVLSFLAFAYGIYRALNRGEVAKTRNELIPTGRRSRFPSRRKIWARTSGYSWSSSESGDISDLIEGVKRGDPESLEMACRGPALLFIAVFVFLAIGFWLLSTNQDGGWVFIGFMVLFMGQVARQTAYSYRLRKQRPATGP